MILFLNWFCCKRRSHSSAWVRNAWCTTYVKYHNRMCCLRNYSSTM